MDHAVDVVILAVNITWASGLNHRQLHCFFLGGR